MNKALFSLLISAPFLLVACGGADTEETPKESTFTVFEITDCVDYFEYLSLENATLEDRSDGIVLDVTCDGYIDYVPNDRFALGFMVDTPDGDKRIGISGSDVSEETLIENSGMDVLLTGNLEIQIVSPSGAKLHVNSLEVN
jgi:hypothetical protein